MVAGAATANYDAVIIGSTPTGLYAALQLAEIGLRVRLQATPDSAWPQLAQPGTAKALRKLVAYASTVLADKQAGETGEIVAIEPGTALVPGKQGALHEMPQPHIYGICGIPLAKDYAQIIGGGASFRAYLDRLLPVLTLGKTQNLARLLQKRLGKTAVNTIKPLISTHFLASFEQLNTACAIPGLNEALTRAGSLTGGVLALHQTWQEANTRLAPASGWQTLKAGLLHAFELLGGEIASGEATLTTAHETTDGERIFTLQTKERATAITCRALIYATDSSERVQELLHTQHFTEIPAVPPADRAILQATLPLPTALTNQPAGSTITLHNDRAILHITRLHPVEAAALAAETAAPQALAQVFALDETGLPSAQDADELLTAHNLGQVTNWARTTFTQPHGTIEAETAANARNAALHSGRLQVHSIALTGGNLGAALDAAETAAVTLRRELANIS